MDQREFFAEATEAQRYKLSEVIGKGSYGVVASAVDQFTGAWLADRPDECFVRHMLVPPWYHGIHSAGCGSPRRMRGRVLRCA